MRVLIDDDDDGDVTIILAPYKPNRSPCSYNADPVEWEAEALKLDLLYIQYLNYHTLLYAKTAATPVVH